MPILRRVTVVRPDGKEKTFRHTQLVKALAFAAGEPGQQLEGDEHPLMRAATGEGSART